MWFLNIAIAIYAICVALFALAIALWAIIYMIVNKK